MRHDETHEDEQDDKRDDKQDKQDETVGYQRPPKRTRFQPGRSGNPRGRPKGALNLKTVLARAIQEPVVITEHGRKKTITKFEAMVIQLTNKAVMGDSRATRCTLDLVQEMESHQDGREPITELLPEADQHIRDRMLRKLAQQAKKGGTPHGSDPDAV